MKALSAILAATTAALCVTVPTVASGMTMVPKDDRCEITLSQSEQESFNQALRDAGLEVEAINLGSVLSFDLDQAQENIDHPINSQVIRAAEYQEAKGKLGIFQDLPEKEKYLQVSLVWSYEHFQDKLPAISRACLKGQTYSTSLLQPPSGPCFPDLTSPTYLPTPTSPTLEPWLPGSPTALPIKPPSDCLAPTPSSPSSPTLTPSAPAPTLTAPAPTSSSSPKGSESTLTQTVTAPSQVEGQSHLEPKIASVIATAAVVVVTAALLAIISNLSAFFQKINFFHF